MLAPGEAFAEPGDTVVSNTSLQRRRHKRIGWHCRLCRQLRRLGALTDYPRLGKKRLARG